MIHLLHHLFKQPSRTLRQGYLRNSPCEHHNINFSTAPTPQFTPLNSFEQRIGKLYPKTFLAHFKRKIMAITNWRCTKLRLVKRQERMPVAHQKQSVSSSQTKITKIDTKAYVLDRGIEWAYGFPLGQFFFLMCILSDNCKNRIRKVIGRCCKIPHV